MVSEGERENTKIVLKDLFGLWDKRANSYGKVLFCSSIPNQFLGGEDRERLSRGEIAVRRYRLQM